VGVVYGSNLKHVKRIAIEIAKNVQANVENAIREFEPMIRFTGFADSSVNFNVIMRAVTFQDQFLMHHELIKRLHVRFNLDGIEIPFPMRTVQIKGPLPTAPATTPTT
ncbi:MAG TPA: mechanosensitive ion channel family protein, partial [Planctomycetota bacterium]|nr:mechanosensitive ion channel family protein [Planctomycetota bacterium]